MSTTEATATANPQVEKPSSLKMVRTLGGVSMLSGLLLFFVYEGTEARIANNKRRALEAAVFTVLPGAESRVTFAVGPDGFTRLDTDDPTAQKVYAGYDAQGKLVGVAIDAAAQGYQDVVRALYGYSPEKQCIIGFTVLESKETPGLGDRIAKDPEFLANFEAMDAQLNDDNTALVHPIETVKAGTKSESWQIDGIAGATISSKAVGRMLGESTEQMLPLIAQHLNELEASS
jgi:electron transport complex protein RnfG